MICNLYFSEYESVPNSHITSLYKQAARYANEPTPNYTGDVRNKMIKVILRELEDDDKYSYLHASEEFEQLMKKLRSVQVK